MAAIELRSQIVYQTCVLINYVLYRLFQKATRITNLNMELYCTIGFYTNLKKLVKVSTIILFILSLFGYSNKASLCPCWNMMSHGSHGLPSGNLPLCKPCWAALLHLMVRTRRWKMQSEYKGLENWGGGAFDFDIWHLTCLYKYMYMWTPITWMLSHDPATLRTVSLSQITIVSGKTVLPWAPELKPFYPWGRNHAIP